MDRGSDVAPLAAPWWDRFPPWAFALGIVLAYLPALRAGFIWDDDVHFVTNPRMLSWRGLLEIWTSRWAVYYPLTSTTFWLMRRLVGLWPLAYHALTLGLHIGTALLFARVLRGLRVPGAMLAALLFALHPVQVESVAWVTELKNTQSAFFLMLSAWALLRSGLLPDNRLCEWRWYARSLVFFVLALLSKPSVVVFPAILLVYLWWRRLIRRPGDVNWLLPYLIGALCFAAWTIWEQRFNSGALGFEWAHSFADRLVTAGRLITFYVGKVLWPHPLCFIYPSLQLSAASLRAWMPLLAVLIALLGLAVNARDWGRPLLAAALMYLLFLFPILGFFNVYFMRYAQAADHFQYLALLVSSATIAAVAARAEIWLRARRAAWSAWLRVAAAALALSYAGLSWRHARVFESPETLWRDTVAQNPRAWMAHNNLGLLLWDRGELPEAEQHFRAALAANPRHYEALCNLGAVLLKRGRLAPARVAFEEAIRLQPDLPQAWFNLGRVHEKIGDWPEAERAFERVISLQPGFSDAYARLAFIAEERNDAARALAYHRKALELATPSSRERAKFLNIRTARFISRQRWTMARAFLDAAREMDPTFEETRQLEAVWQHLLPATPRGE